MKKLLLVLGLVCSGSALFAQSVKFGVQAGVNLAKVSVSADGESASTSNLTGFHAGVIADVDLGGWSLQPGLFYSVKGGKETTNISTTQGGVNYAYYSNSELKFNYLEIPVNLLYNIKVAPGKIFLGGGPYVGFGVSGNTKFEERETVGNTTNTSQGDVEVKYGSGEDQVKNPDFGVNIKAGLRLNSGLSFNAGYGIGLSNLSNSSEGKINHRVLSFGLGFFF